MDKLELRQYQEIVQEIKDLEQEKKELVNLVKPQDGQPHGSGISDPTSTAGVKSAEIVTKINYLVEDLKERRFEIEKAIALLPARERRLMRNHYIYGKTWEQVAVDLNYSYRQVTRLHGQILQKIR